MKVLDYDGLDYYNSLIENKYAPKNSPSFTGNPTALTQAKTDNSTKLATTAFVKNNLNDYATLNGATFTGTVNGITPTAGDNSTKLATTAYVQAELADYVTLNGLSTELSDYLPLAGGTLTGSVITTGKDGRTFSLIGDTATAYPNYDNIDVGWNWENGDGAGIGLRSASNTEAGYFSIYARNGSTCKVLLGNPDGTLTWGGKNVITAAGGTMTGTIIQNHGGITMRGNDDSFVLNFCGGGSATAESGAKLYLHGSSSSSDAGEFLLQAGNSSGTYSQLIGTPTGGLTWKGNNVLTTATVGSVVNKSISSSVSVSASTAKTITSVSLPAGVWVITGHANFGSTTANHMYGIGLSYNNNSYQYASDTSVAIQSSSTRVMALQTSGIFTTTGTKNVYLCAYTSVAASVADAQIYAVRIK